MGNDLSIPSNLGNCRKRIMLFMETDRILKCSMPGAWRSVSQSSTTATFACSQRWCTLVHGGSVARPCCSVVSHGLFDQPLPIQSFLFARTPFRNEMPTYRWSVDYAPNEKCAAHGSDNMREITPRGVGASTANGASIRAARASCRRASTRLQANDVRTAPTNWLGRARLMT